MSTHSVYFYLRTDENCHQIPSLSVLMGRLLPDMYEYVIFGVDFTGK